MANVCNEEFKKQLVKEYIQGKSYSILAKEYGIAKSNLFITIITACQGIGV